MGKVLGIVYRAIATHLTHTIAHRVAGNLEHQGLLERDAGHTYLTASGVDADLGSPMNQLLESSITYRIAESCA